MLILDAHVHIYDHYNLGTLLNSASENLSLNADPNVPVSLGISLTERPECSFFKQISAGNISMPADWTVTQLVDPWTHRFSRADKTGHDLFCFAGRQINTAERIEVAALFYDETIPDEQPADTVINTILEAGGFPVLNWAFGKWLFRRGKLIQNLVNVFGDKLLLCDSSIRPKGWPAPHVYKTAARKQIPILCGTDPLPVPGEEKLVGSFCSIFNNHFDPLHPASSLKKLYRNRSGILTGGRRGSWATVLSRQLHYYSKGC